MVDQHPRYVVREQYGTTVGDHGPSWDLLILDSWYGYGEVLWVKPIGGESVAELRRRVNVFAELLNTPRLCGCGCGEQVPVRPWKSHGIRRQPFYVDGRHLSRAKHARAKVKADGRI